MTMQRNWIGRSEGTEIDFEGRRSGSESLGRRWRSAAAAGLHHPPRPHLRRDVHGRWRPSTRSPRRVAARRADVAAFIDECRRGGATAAELETMEKRGMPLGIEAINPFTGERLPVWVANFVLMGYGTGAVMSVPGHDERDHEFAHRYGLPIRQVIAPADGTEVDIQVTAWDRQGERRRRQFRRVFGARIPGGASTGWRTGSRRPAAAFAGSTTASTTGASRASVTGAARCPSFTATPAAWSLSPDDQLPVVLPEDVDIEGGGSPLARLPEFVETTCPTCGADARRDTDTFDTFMESSWYFARFACADADTSKLDERADYWNARRPVHRGHRARHPAPDVRAVLPRS